MATPLSARVRAPDLADRLRREAGALAYYADHTDEVDAEGADNQRRADEAGRSWQRTRRLLAT